MAKNSEIPKVISDAVDQALFAHTGTPATQDWLEAEKQRAKVEEQMALLTADTINKVNRIRAEQPRDFVSILKKMLRIN